MAPQAWLIARGRIGGSAVWVVAGGTLERLRRVAGREKACTLSKPVRMGHDVDAARHLEKRVLIAERLRGEIAERVLSLAQHGDGRVHVALLADVQPSRQRQASRVHDRVVEARVGGGGGPRVPPTFRGVKCTGPVTALAPDSRPQLSVLAFEKGKWARIARVTGNAPVGQHSIEPRVVELISRAEVPPMVAVPGEGQLEQAAIFLGEIGAADVPASHHVVDPPSQLVETLPVRPEDELDLIELVARLDDRVVESGWLMKDR